MHVGWLVVGFLTCLTWIHVNALCHTNAHFPFRLPTVNRVLPSFAESGLRIKVLGDLFLLTFEYPTPSGCPPQRQIVGAELEVREEW